MTVMDMSMYHAFVTRAQQDDTSPIGLSGSIVMRSSVIEVAARDKAEAHSLASIYVRDHEDTICLYGKAPALTLPVITHVLNTQEDMEGKPPSIEYVGTKPRSAATTADASVLTVNVSPTTTWELVHEAIKDKIMEESDGALSEDAASDLADTACEAEGIPTHKEDDEYPFSSEEYTFNESRYRLLDMGRDEYAIIDFDERTVDDVGVEYREALETVNAHDLYLVFAYYRGNEPGVRSCVAPNVMFGTVMQ